MFAKSTTIVLLLATLALAMPTQELDKRAKCSAQIAALHAGIERNIAVQDRELASTRELQKLLSGDKAKYLAEARALQGIIAEGASIRANNQKIAPAGNKAVAGLKVVEGAQADEAKLAAGLTGGAGDKTTLATLIKDFTNGKKKNADNAAEALTNGCTL